MAALNLAQLGEWAEIRRLLTGRVSKVNFQAMEPVRVARIWYWLGLADEQMGNFAEASTSYASALQIDPRQVTARIRLQILCDGRQQALDPCRARNALKVIEPSYKTKVVVGDWLLAGYDVDLWELAETPLITLVLYWSPRVENAVPSRGWSEIGVHWIELRDAVNLIMNPDFGVDGWGELEELSFWDILYHTRPEQIASAPRDKMPPSLCLTNETPTQRSGLGSLRVRTETGRRYLLAGQVKGTPGTSALLVAAWLDEASRTLGGEQVAAQGQPPAQWQTRAAMVQAPAESHRLWVLVAQFQGTGMACFTDLLLVMLPERESQP
jgi:hypothetical protein